MKPKIVAIGELLVEVMRSEVDRPLALPDRFVGPYPSGAPAIFADAAARLGIETGFIGVVGADAFGENVISRLVADGVDTRHIRTEHEYTTAIAFVAYRGDGGRDFVFHLRQSAAALLGREDIDPTYIASAQFVHVTGSALSVSESARQACYKAIQICKASGGRVSFDPNIRPELLGIDQVREVCQPVLEQCDLLLPSGKEATMLTGDTEIDVACRNLVDRGIPIVALKRGAAGSTVFAAGKVLDVAPIEVVETDPTGAGDCYGAGFVVGLIEGWDLGRTARFANVVGALAVTKRGPMEGAPFRADVLQHL